MRFYKTTCRCDLCRIESIEFEQSQEFDEALIADWLAENGWLAEEHKEYCPDCKVVIEDQRQKEDHEERLVDEFRQREIDEEKP